MGPKLSNAHDGWRASVYPHSFFPPSEWMLCYQLALENGGPGAEEVPGQWYLAGSVVSLGLKPQRKASLLPWLTGVDTMWWLSQGDVWIKCFSAEEAMPLQCSPRAHMEELVQCV